MPSDLINSCKPRGGRLLIIEKTMPFDRSAATAALVRAVRVFSSVSSVPSTSETTSAVLVMG